MGNDAGSRCFARKMLRSCSDSRFQNLSIKGIILFAALASFSILCGCVALADKTAGSASGTSESDDKTKVIASIFAPYDLARQVGGDYAEVSMLVPPGSETHSFEPTPRDIVDLQECDVFIYVGGESDAWLDDLLSSIDTTDKRIVRLMDIVDTLEEVHIEGMQEDDEIVSDESDDEHGQGFEERRAEQDEHDSDAHGHVGEQDEHVWTSVPNAKLIVRAIADVLMETDSVHAASYDQNATDYLQQLDELDDQFREVVAQANRTTVVFGDRFPFLYLAEEYGLRYYAAFSGCSTQTEASANTIAALIERVKEEQIPVVFKIELSNHKIADTIAEQTGTQVLVLHACHNISKDDFVAGATYLSLMEQNVANLRIALN